MKSYRVWEANRKVFLYPENWIEPELRDDKSPFFEELESELLQSEITAESAERAVLGYLHKLDDVVRLEVMGFFHQKPEEHDPADILHVFARTRGTPPRYYYRQRVNGTRWTPWEKVEVDIEGDHLLPAVHNRRLYLFWPQITEAALEEVPDTPDKGGDKTQEKPEKYFQIRLAWSERRGGKWAGKKLSTVQIGATPDDYSRLSCGLRKAGRASRSDFFFRAYRDDADLIVEAIRYVYTLAHAAAYGALSHAAVERILAARCAPRSLDEYVAEHTAMKLEPLLGRSRTEPRDLTEYDNLPLATSEMERPCPDDESRPPPPTSSCSNDSEDTSDSSD